MRNESDTLWQTDFAFIVDTRSKEIDTSESKIFLLIILLYKLCYLFSNILPKRINFLILGIPHFIEDVKSLNLIPPKKQLGYSLESPNIIK